MRVKDGDNYILSGSAGGAPKNPVCVYNLRANPLVEIRGRHDVRSMRVREVTDAVERSRLSSLAVQAYPPYEDYQRRTTRKIPVLSLNPLIEEDF
jgi:deazaflavin-dependent oxidoreductase (nitroreductase family)